MDEQPERDEQPEDDAERECESIVARLRVLPDEERRGPAEAEPQQVRDDLDIGRKKTDPEKEEQLREQRPPGSSRESDTGKSQIPNPKARCPAAQFQPSDANLDIPQLRTLELSIWGLGFIA